MSVETLGEFLEEHRAGPTVIQHAVRYAIGELSGDLSVEEMLTEMSIAADPSTIEELSDQLSRNGALLADIDLMILSMLWDDPQSRDIVRGAVTDATDKLPIVETVLVVTAAMYGLHLLVTRGKKKEVKRVKHTPDGYEETTEVEYRNFSSAVRSISGLLTNFVNLS
jgi:hypothetical protein